MATDGVELSLDNLQLLGLGAAGQSAGDAIYLGGGFGGLYLGSVAEYGYSVGLRIDTAVTGTANNQIFISNRAAFDSNTNAAIYLDDAISSFKSFTMMGWVASTQNPSGSSIAIVNWKNGTFNITGAQVVSNFGHGISVLDATAKVFIALRQTSRQIVNMEFMRRPRLRSTVRQRIRSATVPAITAVMLLCVPRHLHLWTT